jgi:ABC-type Fe3+ transport system substrate-binding protein
MFRNTLFALLLSFSSSEIAFAADPRPAWRVDWDKTVAAAEKEGVVSIYIFEAGPLTEEAVQGFERAYPKIKVNQLRGRGNDLGPRLVAERRAGKYLADLFAGGKGTAYTTLYVGKMLDAIKPLLVLPEVVDESKWWRGELKYVDPENKHIFVYIGNAGGVEINHNTNLVNPREFGSYWDLIQPKWKGKIVAVDPRMRGMDNPVLFFYYHSKLGPDFIKKLYGDMEVSIARDYRQPTDWLASGKFAICIPCVSDEMDKAMEQGLPVGQVFRLKEGGTLSSSGGTLSLLQNAPHPNAAKVFVNWLLSREGQMHVQKGRKGRPRTGSNSLRIDIPKNEIPEEIQRREGVDYFDADDERHADRRPADKLFNEIFGKTAK